MRFIFFLSTLILLSCFSVAAQERPPAKVVVAEITREVISENRSYIGRLSYDRMSRVSTDVSGLVEEILVKEGDKVAKASPLVRLDTELLEQEIALKETRIEQAELRIELARKNLKRFKTLLSRKGTSEKNYDDALHTFQDAQSEKKLSELELAKLRIQQRKSIIKAPFDGIILEKNVESGDWVQQGTQLVSIGSTRDLIALVPVEESAVQFISVGDQVPVTVNAFNRELTGTVIQIGPVADARTKNVFIKVGLKPLDNVAENMSATVFIPTSKKRELSLIPRDALIKFQGKDFVYTVKEGKASILPVNIVTFLGNKIGADNPYFTPGMVVVIEGNERLRPDQPVTVAEDK